ASTLPGLTIFVIVKAGSALTHTVEPSDPVLTVVSVTELWIANWPGPQPVPGSPVNASGICASYLNVCEAPGSSELDVQFSTLSPLPIVPGVQVPPVGFVVRL